MFNIVLVNPEIPPNTGNVIRLAANTGCTLHLVKPLGFSLADHLLRRAGLDYREYADLRVHESWEELLACCRPQRPQMFAFSSHGETPLSNARFSPGDWLVFGCESKGLPGAFQREFFDATRILRIPMRPGNRSLNLSNSVAVAVYEAWRQNGYAGASLLHGRESN